METLEREKVKRASTKTELRLAFATAEVGLYKIAGDDAKDRNWDSAGPNGNKLLTETRPVEAPIEEKGDALGVTPIREEAPEDPGPEEVPPIEETAPTPPSADAVPAETKRVLVEAETGIEIEPEDVRKGIRFDDGRFVDLTDQIETVEEESRVEGLQVLGFLRRERVPRERVICSYYLGAESGSGAKLLRTLYEGMRDAGRVAVVRWTKRRGQTLGIVVPHSSGALVALEMLFAERVRDPNAKCLAHLQAEVTRGVVDRAVELIESMSWSPSQFDEIRNRRVELERELYARADAGEVEGYEIEPEKPIDDLAELADLLSAA